MYALFDPSYENVYKYMYVCLQIQMGGVQHYIGVFDSEEDAAAAYKQASDRLYRSSRNSGSSVSSSSNSSYRSYKNIPSTPTQSLSHNHYYGIASGDRDSEERSQKLRLGKITRSIFVCEEMLRYINTNVTLAGELGSSHVSAADLSSGKLLHNPTDSNAAIHYDNAMCISSPSEASDLHADAVLSNLLTARVHPTGGTDGAGMRPHVQASSGCCTEDEEEKNGVDDKTNASGEMPRRHASHAGPNGASIATSMISTLSIELNGILGTKQSLTQLKDNSAFNSGTPSADSDNLVTPDLTPHPEQGSMSVPTTTQKDEDVARKEASSEHTQQDASRTELERCLRLLRNEQFHLACKLKMHQSPSSQQTNLSYPATSSANYDHLLPSSSTAPEAHAPVNATSREVREKITTDADERSFLRSAQPVNAREALSLSNHAEQSMLRNSMNSTTARWANASHFQPSLSWMFHHYDSSSSSSSPAAQPSSPRSHAYTDHHVDARTHRRSHMMHQNAADFHSDTNSSFASEGHMHYPPRMYGKHVGSYRSGVVFENIDKLDSSIRGVVGRIRPGIAIDWERENEMEREDKRLRTTSETNGHYQHYHDANAYDNTLGDGTTYHFDAHDNYSYAENPQPNS
jgi:hypothetical protein